MAAYTVLVFIVLSSLDNMALAVLPPMYRVTAAALGVNEDSVGFITALSILVVALSSAVWGYWSDRRSRKRLLLAGTIIWVCGVGLSSAAVNYGMLLACQIAAAAGLGAINSVGFSLISEFIRPERRGLMLALWGICQAVGAGAGVLLGGTLGSVNWRLPFYAVALLGLAFAALGWFARDPLRGRLEGPLSSADREPASPLSLRDLLRRVPAILQRQTNGWVLLQGLAAQFAFGSLLWLPRVFEAKATAASMAPASAMAVGSVLALTANAGGLFSVAGGYIGDRWYRKGTRGRAFLCAIASLVGLPLFIGMLFVPLTTEQTTLLPGLPAAPGVALIAALSFIAYAFTSMAAPNWMAMVTDVNLPEHRGTMIGIINLLNGLGRALGNGLMGVVIAVLAGPLGAPWNHVGAMILFQLFFIPCALCFLRAARWLPGDVAFNRQALAARSRAGT